MRCITGPFCKFVSIFSLFLLTCLVPSCGHRIVVLNDPLSPSEHNDLAVLYENAGKLDLAVHHYILALKGEPANPLYHFNLGNCLFKKGKWKDAEKEFEKAYSLERSSPTYLNNLCYSKMKLGKDLDWCLSEMEQLIDGREDLPWEFYETSGEVAISHGSAEKAKSFFEGALKRCGQDCSDDIKRRLRDKILTIGNDK